MRVSPGSSSIQMLKAQQAWEARRAGRKPDASAPAAMPQPAVPAPTVAVSKPAASAASAAPAGAPQWEQRVRDIQQIAQRAGYLGVSEQDIRRAYTHGESLLADYRV